MASEPLEGLASLLGPGGLLLDASDFPRYETGWRYGAGRALAVARPRTPAETAAVLGWCSGHGVPVVPQGGNTGLVGASVPDASGEMLVLSLERLDRRLEIDPLDRTVFADGGVLLGALNAALAVHGLHFPVDLGADPSVGGMVATNTGGTRLLRYGDVRHNLLGVEVVLASGEVVAAPAALRKNNTGLDWKQLFTGTSGAFGVVTGALLQARPLPRQRAAALVALEGGEAALALLRGLEGSLWEVLTAFEAMGAEAFGCVFRHQDRLVNPFGEVPPLTVLVEVASGLPETALDLAPLLEDALGSLAADGGILDARFGRPEAFWEIRHHVSESLRSEGRVLGLDVAVPRSRLPAFLEAARARVAGAWPHLKVCDFGHWGDGGVHLNLVAPPGTPLEVREVQDAIYDLVVGTFRGSFSAEHGVGPHNQRVWDARTPRAVKAAGAALKAHFDPGGRLGRVRLW
jgi:FAD/FMN-containing dehydrogenase